MELMRRIDEKYRGYMISADKRLDVETRDDFYPMKITFGKVDVEDTDDDVRAMFDLNVDFCDRLPGARLSMILRGGDPSWSPTLVTVNEDAVIITCSMFEEGQYCRGDCFQMIIRSISNNMRINVELTTEYCEYFVIRSQPLNESAAGKFMTMICPEHQFLEAKTWDDFEPYETWEICSDDERKYELITKRI